MEAEYPWIGDVLTRYPLQGPSSSFHSKNFYLAQFELPEFRKLFGWLRIDWDAGCFG